MTAAAELARISQAADDAISAVKVSLCTGDELYRALTRELGYGSQDERLRTFMRRIQRTIERSSA